MRSKRLLAVLLSTFSVVVVVGGCGDDSETASDNPATTPDLTLPSDEPDVTIQTDTTDTTTDTTTVSTDETGGVAPEAEDTTEATGGTPTEQQQTTSTQQQTGGQNVDTSAVGGTGAPANAQKFEDFCTNNPGAC